MGKFFTQENLPYFSPREGEEHEILTSQGVGLKMEIGIPGDRILLPNRYYYLGDVSESLELQFGSGTPGHLAEYRGEFTVTGESVEVTFPAQIKWAGVLQPESLYSAPVGTVVQFQVVNGIGNLLSVLQDSYAPMK